MSQKKSFFANRVNSAITKINHTLLHV